LASYLAGAKLPGDPRHFTVLSSHVKDNVFLVDPGTLSGASKPDDQGTLVLGQGYDVIVDVNGDLALDSGDLLDGSADQAGFYGVEDFVDFRAGSASGLETGPYAVTESLFDGGTTLRRQDVFFPTDIAKMGQLPVIVVSHGNGHNYRWYNHIGFHMASWGY